MLRVSEISVEYSGMKALQKVSITLNDDEFVSIIGSNGAGKSTLLKAISGTVGCTSGEIIFGGINITKMAAHRRTGLGIIHVPEGRRIFPSLNVMENLMVGAYRDEARASINGNLERVLKFFPILRERRDQLGGSLSGGEQQILAIGRGLMAMPQIFMLDEPSLGLSPRLVEFIFEAIREVREKLKFSILLVEQRATEALELCDRGYILETGGITMSSDRENLIGNPLVQRAYFGTK
jgi:branched-chain amino acid transport system ATP-binding protein